MDRRRGLKAHRLDSEEATVRYREANREVQREARRDKVKWIDEQCSLAETGLNANAGRIRDNQRAKNRFQAKTT